MGVFLCPCVLAIGTSFAKGDLDLEGGSWKSLGTLLLQNPVMQSCDRMPMRLRSTHNSDILKQSRITFEKVRSKPAAVRDGSDAASITFMPALWGCSILGVVYRRETGN